MKKFKTLISCMLSAAIVLSSVTFSLTTTSAVERNYKLVDVTAHIFSMDKTDKVTCLIYDDLPTVPSVNLEQYTNLLFDGGSKLEEQENNVYELTLKGGNTVLFDTENDIIHFDNYDVLTNTKMLPKKDSDEKQESWFVKDIVIEQEGLPVGVDMNLGKYGIDIVEESGDVYIPLPSFNDAFSSTYLGSVYVDNELYFVETVEDPYYDMDSVYDKTTRSQAEADYTYNELCFVFDTLYGRPSKAEFSEKLNDKSFDEVLESDAEGRTIKALLKSEKLVDFFFGLARLDSQLDDGGHTSLCIDFYSTTQFFCESGFAKAYKNAVQEPENKENAEAVEAYSKNVNNMDFFFAIMGAGEFDEKDIVKKWGDLYEPITFVVHDDTALFSFDSFIDDVVESFKWSLDYAKSHNIKNFIVDISKNGGGSSDVLMYISSLIMDVNYISGVNTMTGQPIKIKDIIDKNLDGIIDEKDDAVKYDFNYAILTTQGSFSCGNLLPCMAHDNNIPVIGETSGGGACMLTKSTFPCGFSYAFSGSTNLCFKDGTDVDLGAPVDYNIVSKNDLGKSDYSKLYNFDLLSKYINEFYGAKVDISNCKLTVKNKIYNGKSQKPPVKVTYGSKVLKEGEDYTLSYKNNKKVGEGKVVIKGNGSFTGTVTHTFKINPKGATIKKLSPDKKSFTVKWSKRTMQTTGYKLQYSLKSNFKSAKTITIKNNKKTAKKIKKLKSKKKYYVRIKTYKKVGTNTYSSSWSTAKNVKTK